MHSSEASRTFTLVHPPPLSKPPQPRRKLLLSGDIPVPCPRALTTSSLRTHFRDLIEVDSYSICPLVIGFFYSVWFSIIHAVTYIRTWLLSVAEEHSIVWTEHVLLIHSSVVLGCFHLLVFVPNALSAAVRVSVWVPAFNCASVPSSRRLAHTVSLCWTEELRTCPQQPHCPVPTSSAQASRFSMSSPHCHCLCFLSPGGGEAVSSRLICISLRTADAEHLLTCSHLLWRNVLQVLCPFFNWVVCLFTTESYDTFSPIQWVITLLTVAFGAQSF